MAVRPVAVDAAQAYLARDAYARFCKGSSPRGLNDGDCFAYALAQTMVCPLVFKGEDFAWTDVMSALARSRDLHAGERSPERWLRRATWCATRCGAICGESFLAARPPRSGLAS